VCGELLSDASHQKLKLTSFEQLGNDEPPTLYVIIVSAKPTATAMSGAQPG
jgi:hypothetical protein